jgi:hypothetical protein
MGETLQSIRVLLDLILGELKGAGIRGDPAIAGDGIELHKGAVRLELGLSEWVGRARQLHVHVLTRMIGSEAETVLESCVIGMGADEDAAAAQAAKIWLSLAGAPIFSLLDGAEVMSADHFSGDEPWGVPGAHGFVGPVMVRGGDPDMESLAVAPWFAAVPELFPGAFDGGPHLVKATWVSGVGGGLTLELDGHAGVGRVEVDWASASQTRILGTRYALFFAPEG